MNRRNFIKNSLVVFSAITLPIVALSNSNQIIYNPDVDFEKFASKLVSENILHSLDLVGKNGIGINFPKLKYVKESDASNKNTISQTFKFKALR